jgi:hypothetical protein
MTVLQLSRSKMHHCGTFSAYRSSGVALQHRLYQDATQCRAMATAASQDHGHFQTCATLAIGEQAFSQSPARCWREDSTLRLAFGFTVMVAQDPFISSVRWTSCRIRHATFAHWHEFLTPTTYHTIEFLLSRVQTLFFARAWSHPANGNTRNMGNLEAVNAKLVQTPQLVPGRDLVPTCSFTVSSRGTVNRIRYCHI